MTSSNYVRLPGAGYLGEETVGQFNQQLKNPTLSEIRTNEGSFQVKVESQVYLLDELVTKLFAFREDLFDKNGDGLSYHEAAQKLAPLIRQASDQEQSFCDRVYRIFACCCFCFEDCYKEYQKQCILSDAKRRSDVFLSALPRRDDEEEVDLEERETY